MATVSKKNKKKKLKSTLKTFMLKSDSSEKAYYKYLDNLLDQFYVESYERGWSWKDLASKSNLSYSTIFAIGHRYVRYPRLFTIYKIAKSLGYELAVQRVVSLKKKKAA